MYHSWRTLLRGVLGSALWLDRGIEVYQGDRDGAYRIGQWGFPIRQEIPAEQTQLSKNDYGRALSSRAKLLMEARVENSQAGGLYGLVAWIATALACAAYLILRLVQDNYKSVGMTVVQRAGRLGYSVQSANAARKETASLRSEVRRLELLTRKAEAEAKLKREHPDAVHHEVVLRRAFHK